MSAHLPSFQRYQLEFTQHLRDPKHHPRPKGVPAERMAVYKEIVFNNIVESISACFPVAQQVLGKRAWRKLLQAFVREHSASTPIFRKMPEEFLVFLTASHAETQQLPAYFASLCHYEWIELFVAYMPISKAEINETEANHVSPTGNLLKNEPIFTGAMQLLNYDYAVHKISSRRKPKSQEETQLLVYRNAQDDVKFIEINAITFKLITLIQQQAMTGEQALILLASELNHLQPETIIQFGLTVLEDLRKQGVILGVLKNQVSKIKSTKPKLNQKT